MKINHRIALGTLLAGVLCLAVSPAQALTEKEITSINTTIGSAPAAELAVKAAEMVKQADKKQKEATAVAAVRAAITRNPAIAVTVVSSVVKAAPATAPAVAAAAARLAPTQIEAIAVAAALAAPDKAEMIVAALAEVDPKSEQKIAAAIVPAVPRTEARVRTRNTDGQANHQGETYSSSALRLDGSQFPLTPPVRVYSSPAPAR